MPPQDPKKPLPKCKALLLCEKCIIEEGTRRVSLINVFNSFQLQSFPGRVPDSMVFLQLVDGIGRYQLNVTLIDLETDQVISRMNTSVEFPVRPMKRNLLIPVRSITLTHPGKYDVVVSGDGEEIERQSFTAQLKGV